MIPEGRKYCSILSGGIDSTIISKILDSISETKFLHFVKSYRKR